MNLLRKENMFSLLSLSKSKFLTRVVIVLFVSHSCRTRVARIAFVLHPYCLCWSCYTRVTLMLLVLHTPVARMALVLLVSALFL